MRGCKNPDLQSMSHLERLLGTKRRRGVGDKKTADEKATKGVEDVQEDERVSRCSLCTIPDATDNSLRAGCEVYVRTGRIRCLQKGTVIAVKGLRVKIKSVSHGKVRTYPVAALLHLNGDVSRCMAAAIQWSKMVMVLSGAGCSTEAPSSIPDFRGGGALEFGALPELVASIDALEYSTDEFWAFFRNLFLNIHGKVPNDAHVALAELQNCGKHPAVQIFTQNVDGLHQAAGSSSVVELHGSAFTCSCMACKRVFHTSSILLEGKYAAGAPMCETCESPIRPDITLYGEPVRAKSFTQAHQAAKKCDVLMVVGTSLEVEPAASLLELARRAGAIVLILNAEPSRHSQLAHFFYAGKAATTLRSIAKAIEQTKAL